MTRPVSSTARATTPLVNSMEAINRYHSPLGLPANSASVAKGVEICAGLADARCDRRIVLGVAKTVSVDRRGQSGAQIDGAQRQSDQLRQPVDHGYAQVARVPHSRLVSSSDDYSTNGCATAAYHCGPVDPTARAW